MNSSSKCTQSGFTLIELIVAVAILSIIGIASYSSLIKNTEVTKSYEANAKLLTELQQFSLIVDRDFAHLLQKDATLSDNTISFISEQEDTIVYISYEFTDTISRTTTYLGSTEKYTQTLITDIKKPSVKVVDSTSNKLVTSWSNKNRGYLKAVEIKFTHPRYGELTKLALITE